MSNLPQLDPVKLYSRALTQIGELNSQNIQMDAMIEALRDERDKAIEERDKAQAQLASRPVPDEVINITDLPEPAE